MHREQEDSTYSKRHATIGRQESLLALGNGIRADAVDAQRRLHAVRGEEVGVRRRGGGIFCGSDETTHHRCQCPFLKGGALVSGEFH